MDKVLRGFEPRSLDSESRVLTVTPRGPLKHIRTVPSTTHVRISVDVVMLRGVGSASVGEKLGGPCGNGSLTSTHRVCAMRPEGLAVFPCIAGLVADILSPAGITIDPL